MAENVPFQWTECKREVEKLVYGWLPLPSPSPGLKGEVTWANLTKRSVVIKGNTLFIDTSQSIRNAWRDASFTCLLLITSLSRDFLLENGGS